MKISTKILLCVGFASLFAGEGIIVYARKAVHGALLAHIRLSAESDAHQAAGPLAEAIVAADERRILPILHSFLRDTEGVYAVVIDRGGRVLSHSNVAEVGKVYQDARTAAALKSEAATSMETEINGKRILDVAVPVFADASKDSGDDFLLAGGGAAEKGARVGTLRVGLPLDATLATERAISAAIFRGVLLLGGAAGVILFGFMRRVLAPIGLLAAATAKIREGDYRVAVPETTGDEIGVLARGFNEMSRELGRTTVSKDFFNDILDSIQDEVIVTDAAGLIVLVNPAVVKLLGWSREELIGRPADSLLDGGSLSFLTPTSNAAAHFVTKTGEKTAVLFSASAIKSADGAATGFIGAAKDVSDVRKLEARMHQSEKLSAVGQLAAGVAHEINNPLGVILGFSQGMARQLKPGDALELPIRSIEREALRCKALVQNLLTFARTSHSDRAPMDVNQTIEQSLSLIAPQAKIARVAVTTRLAPALPPVLGNKNQLEQVIMNLAKNAIDAMPAGGALVLSTELVEEAPHSWIFLRFIDDGSGIPAAVLPKIFDPFFTTKPIGQGTGLGLSLVSEIVQKHSGEISVESRPGRTEFTVKLPARTGQELDSRVPSLSAEQAAARGVTGSIAHAKPS